MNDTKQSYIDTAIDKISQFTDNPLGLYLPLFQKFVDGKINNNAELNVFISLLLGGSLSDQHYLWSVEEKSFKISPKYEEGYSRILFEEHSDKVEFALKALSKLKSVSEYNPYIEIFNLENAVTDLKGSVAGGTLSQYLLKHSSKEDVTLQINKITFDIFFNLFKSILVGEYLSDSEYSYKISQVIKHNGENILECQNPETFEIQNEIRIFLRKIERFCKSLRKSILPPDKVSNNEIITIDGFISPLMPDIHCRHLHQEWVKILNAILNITYIDHIFITTQSNLRILCAALEDIKLLNLDLKFSTNGKEQKTFDEHIKHPLEKKATILLRQMTDQHIVDDENDICVEYYFADDKLRSDIQSPYELEQKEFPHQKYVKGEYREYDFEFLEKELPSNKKSYDIVYKGSNNEDLREYNLYVVEAFKGHKSHQEIRKEIDNESYDTDTLNKITTYLTSTSFFPSAPFLFNVIRFLYRHSDKLTRQENADFDTAHRWVNTLQTAINKLSQHLNRLKNCTASPMQVRGLFEWSYYQVADNKMIQIDSKKKNDNIPVITFISAASKPVNILFLSNFVNKYQQRANDLLRRISNLAIERNNKQAASLTERFKEETEKMLHDERVHNMQILGILAAFISLISVLGVGITKDVHPIVCGIYMIIAMICILSFTFIFNIFMSSPPIKQPNPEEKVRIKYSHNWWIAGGITALVVTLIISIVFLLPIDKNEPIEEHATDKPTEIEEIPLTYHTTRPTLSLHREAVDDGGDSMSIVSGGAAGNRQGEAAVGK